jgi:rSAM/selenodomain-associated transferase 2
MRVGVLGAARVARGAGVGVGMTRVGPGPGRPPAEPVADVTGLALEPLVTVVVPALDEASTLPALLDHLAELPGCWEFVVADGGSRDGTPELAAAHPLAPRVAGPVRGRADQCNAAAAAATGEVLLFLHADSRLPPGAHAALAAALRDPAVAGGNFALRFDGEDRFSRLLTAWYAVQRRAGIYYGDSTIWLRASAFTALGGYRPLPIMDDYDLVRRLERRYRTACLPGPATTSPRRWKALGVPRTVLSWVVIRWLFLAGVPPARLARLYRRVR